MVPKFRAWDKEGKLYQDEEVSIVRGQFVKSSYAAAWWMKEAELFNVQQSTGLKDKNGVEIFEGDILVNQYGNVGYVAYLQQEAGFVVVKKKSDYRLGHRNTGESYDVTTNHEVIGNIHSNPELLDKSNEN